MVTAPPTREETREDRSAAGVHTDTYTHTHFTRRRGEAERTQKKNSGGSGFVGSETVQGQSFVSGCFFRFRAGEVKHQR